MSEWWAHYDPNQLPIVVTLGRVPPTVVASHKGRIELVSAEKVLWEPHPVSDSQYWYSSLYARLMAISTGPVLWATHEDCVTSLHALRLREAGMPHIIDLQDVDLARRRGWPTFEAVRQISTGVGSPAPKLVLVGETDPKGTGRPFHSRSGLWLMRALRELGHDELTCYLTNGYTTTGGLKTDKLQGLQRAFERYNPTWVALGAKAASALGGAGINSIKIHSPGYARRYKFNDWGPVGYAEHMSDNGVPRGPWDAGADADVSSGKLLPVHPAQGTPQHVPRIMRVDTSVAHKPQGKRALASYDESKSRAIIEQARRLYVTGQVRHISEAAKQVGLNKDTLYKFSAHPNERGEDWHTERERYLRQEREQVYAASQEAQARAVADCSKLAWAGVKLSMSLYVKRLQKQVQQQAQGVEIPQKELPGAYDVAQMTKTAALLAQQDSDLLSDEERELSELTFPELIRKAAGDVIERYGPEMLEFKEGETVAGDDSGDE